jgi:hypothetical protein
VSSRSAPAERVRIAYDCCANRLLLRQSGGAQLELVEPDVVPVSQWRLEVNEFGVPDAVDAFGGVACKP